MARSNGRPRTRSRLCASVRPGLPHRKSQSRCNMLEAVDDVDRRPNKRRSRHAIYWIHLTMEYFADDFEFCDAIYGATTCYRLKRPLSREKCMVDLKEMSFGKKMDLLARSGKNAGWGSPTVAPFMRSIYAVTPISVRLPALGSARYAASVASGRFPRTEEPSRRNVQSVRRVSVTARDAGLLLAPNYCAARSGPSVTSVV